MKVIRNSVWETNSSSSHTVSIRGKKNITKYAFVGDSKSLGIHLDEYGWSGPDCDDFMSKLEYAMCMVLMTEYPDFRYWDEHGFTVNQTVLESLDGYQLLLSAVRTQFPDCKEIVIKKNDGYYPYGYIDHQSCENYSSLRDFLEDWNLTAERYLFDYGVVVHIDNDNG